MKANKLERVLIRKVYINENHELFLLLESSGKFEYEHVYRAAAGVYWDQQAKGFKSVRMGERSCSDWFVRIVDTVRHELGFELFFSGLTSWENVPKAEIEKIHVAQDRTKLS